MSRKLIPAAAPAAVEANAEALAQAGQAATELVLLNERNEANLQALSDALQYEGPLSIDSLEEGIRFYQKRTVEACLELGKRLLLLKEMAGHGDFSHRVDTLGIDRRLCQRLASAAFKFAKAVNRRFLEAAGNQSKLLELVVLDDDEIDTLSNGGSIGEVDLDAVASMSTTELRAALREAREGMEAKDRVISGQADKINTQAEQLAKPFKPKKNDPAKNAEDAAALTELTEATNGADVMFDRLAVVVAELQGHSSEAIRARALQAVQYLVVRMREVVLHNALEVTVNDETLSARPAWLGAAE